MAEQQDLDRNENATPYKLEQARKRGQVAKSADVVSATVFAVAVASMYAVGWDRLHDLFRFDLQLFRQGLHGDRSPAGLWFLVEQALHAGLALTAPLLIAIVLAAILGNVAHTGFNFTFDPIKPDLQRINPMSGFKRVFSMRTLFDALRSCVKLAVLAGVVYAALKALLPQFGQVAALPTAAQLHLLFDDVAALSVRIAMALAVVAAMDLAYSKREFGKKMRMSRRELKDETKNRDGDPRIRSRLRELRREMLKRSQSLAKARDADVVITNPTHVAVALKYKHGEMDAPVVLSKGKGALAAAVRRIAQQRQIPIVHSPVLARALYAQGELDRQIPISLFTDVARVMVWVMARQRAAGASGSRGVA